MTAVQGWSISFKCNRCGCITGNAPDLEDTREHFDVLESVRADSQADALAAALREQTPDKLSIVMRPSHKRGANEQIMLVYRGEEPIEYVTLEPGTKHRFTCRRVTDYVGMLPSGAEVEKVLIDAGILPKMEKNNNANLSTKEKIV